MRNRGKSSPVKHTRKSHIPLEPVEISIEIHDGTVSQRSYKVMKTAPFSAVRKKLVNLLHTENIVLTEYEKDEEVDLESALFSAKSFSDCEVPALKLKATVVHDEEPAVEPAEEPSVAFKHVTVARILHRNVKECIHAAQTGTSPSSRKRHNSAGLQPVDKRPRIDTFIKDTKELSVTLKSFSSTMEMMSNVLDGSLQGDDYNEENIRKLIQNTMDAGRYFIPILQSMTKMVIPDKWNADTEIQLVGEVAQAPCRREVVKGKAADALDSFRNVL